MLYPASFKHEIYILTVSLSNNVYKVSAYSLNKMKKNSIMEDTIHNHIIHDNGGHNQ